MSAKQDWLDAVMATPKRIDGRALTDSFHGYHEDGSKYYYLPKKIDWQPEGNASGNFEPVHVPAGFVTDLTSIPKIVLPLLPRDDSYLAAAIFHDYVYWVGDRDRLVADDILWEIMVELGVGAIKKRAIYWPVRRLGGKAWKNNKTLRRSGESRCLKEFPKDIKITWKAWKQDSEHFFDCPASIGPPPPNGGPFTS